MNSTAGQAVRGVVTPDLPTGLLVAAIVLTMMAVVAIGGHPIVVASVLLAIFVNVDTPLNDLVVAMSVLLGWGCSAMIAPAGLIIIVSTAMFEISRKSVIVSANARLVVVNVALGIAALTLLNMVLP